MLYDNCGVYRNCLMLLHCVCEDGIEEKSKIFKYTSEFRITDFLIFSLNYILADCMNLMLKKIFIWLLHLAPGKFIKITGSICFREHKILQWWVALFIENNNHNFLPARIYAEQRLFYYHSCNLIFI